MVQVKRFQHFTHNPNTSRGIELVAFKVGQKVVYPNHGVSVIEKIGSSTIDGVEQVYYHLRLLSNDSKVMIPKQNLDLVGLRPLGKKTEIQILFDILSDGNIDTYKDWKGRYKQNLDKMKTGELLAVTEVLKNLRLVSEKKSLSFREKKMYERAKYFIVSEVSHVRNITEEAADQEVDDALDSSILKRSKSRKAPKVVEVEETSELAEPAKAVS